MKMCHLKFWPRLHPRSPENVHQVFTSFKNAQKHAAQHLKPKFKITNISHVYVWPSSLTPLVPSAFSPCLIGEFGTTTQHQEKKNKFKHRKKSRLCPGKHVQELLAAESLSHDCVSFWSGAAVAHGNPRVGCHYQSRWCQPWVCSPTMLLCDDPAGYWFFTDAGAPSEATSLPSVSSASPERAGTKREHTVCHATARLSYARHSA